MNFKLGCIGPLVTLGDSEGVGWRGPSWEGSHIPTFEVCLKMIFLFLRWDMIC